MNAPAQDALALQDISDVVQRHWSGLRSKEASKKLANAFERIRQGEAVRPSYDPAPAGPLDMPDRPVVNSDGVGAPALAVLLPAEPNPRISG